jgi:hypothetical protein
MTLIVCQCEPNRWIRKFVDNAETKILLAVRLLKPTLSNEISLHFLSTPMIRSSLVLLLSCVMLAGCSLWNSPAEPDPEMAKVAESDALEIDLAEDQEEEEAPSEFRTTGVRYVPATIPDGPASLWALEQAERDAKKKLRNNILKSQELDWAPDDINSLVMRDEYMRARLDEIIRLVEVEEKSYSRDERRAEVTVAIEPEEFQEKFMAAYSARPPRSFE